MSHTLENGIGTIKFRCQFLTMFSLKGSLFIRLQWKKHLISFNKLTFRATLIFLLLHAILGHDQILFEGMENILSNCKCLVNRLTFETLGRYERTKGGFFPYTVSKGFM
jgi:hypothetical protein